MLPNVPIPAIDFNGPGLLPERLQPYAKALYPFLSSLIVMGVLWIVNGTYDQATFIVNVTGLGMAFLTFLVPNGAAVHVHSADSLEDEATTTLGTPMDEWDPDRDPEPPPDSAAAQIHPLDQALEPVTADTDLHNHIGGPQSSEAISPTNPPPEEGSGHAGAGEGE